MATVVFKQGDTAKLIVPLVDRDGQAFDITTAEEITASLRIANTEVALYKLNGGDGYGTLEKGVATNTVEILVQSSESKNFPVGNVTAAVAVLMPVSSEFPLGERIEFSPINAVALVKQGFLKDEIIP